MVVNKDRELSKAIEEITAIAIHYGLDFYPMRYEICPPQIIYTFGAYRMPTRFSHWSFGKRFYKMKTHYDVGLNKIYELVINSNPCYAFLLDSNSLIENKLIIAHVIAHSDFFKNNLHYRLISNENIIEKMATTAERIEMYEELYGRSVVESFLDAVISIEEHVNPVLGIGDNNYNFTSSLDKITKTTTKYNGVNDPLSQDFKQLRLNTVSTSAEKDLLFFIEKHSPILTDWQRDIISMIREESVYFSPQFETKILNEGWATYWHQKIVRQLNLSSSEIVEYAKLNSQITKQADLTLNPYYLGMKLFQHIEANYNCNYGSGREKNSQYNDGREKIFAVREIETDSSFLRNYLSEEFILKEELFLYTKQGDDFQVISKSAKDIKTELIRETINGGFPYVVVKDGDYLKNGELYLEHYYDGLELDLNYLEKVIQYIFQLWGRAIHFETVVDNRQVVFIYDGRSIQRKYI